MQMPIQKAHTPKIKVMRPQASYLIWLDCRELGLSHEALNAFFVDKAGLALNDGEMFGKEGAGFMRMNVGCPRVTLEKALQQIESSLRSTLMRLLYIKERVRNFIE